MTRYMGIFTVTILAWAAPCAWGQETLRTGDPERGDVRTTKPAERMAENVEVMRRVLLRQLGRLPLNCQGCHGGGSGFGAVFGDVNDGRIDVFASGGGAGATGFWRANQDFRRVLGQGSAAVSGVHGEGVYLAGYGVVYSMSIAASPQVMATHSSATEKVSDWDEVQKQVRGEKTSGKAAPKRAPRVTDIILQTLAENGKHLSQLKAEELVTIVVSFRDPHPAGVHVLSKPQAGWFDAGGIGGGVFGGGGFSAGGFGSGGGGGGGSGGFGGGAGAAGSGFGGGTGGSAGGAGGGGRGGIYGRGGQGGGTASSSGAGSGSSSPSTANDYALLADLLLKQGKAKEAVTAMKKALEMESKVSRRLLYYRRLAQAHLAADEIANAEAALKTLGELRRKVAPDKSGTTSVPVSRAVPPQLIVYAPKSMLDRIGSGQMTLAEFSRMAGIERRGFQEAAK